MSLANISFKGKKVLVTGAARGLGRDIVKSLHEQEAIIYALARNPTNLENLKKEFPNIQTIQVDLADWNATKIVLENLEPLDHLVNNAGVVGISSFLAIQPDQFDEIMNINVKSVINVSQIIAKKMIDNGIKGSIVNVSSLGSKMYSKGLTTYCTSKAALDMLTYSMAIELGPQNIRVNSVNPSIFPSDMSKAFLNMNPDGGEAYQQRIPLKRITQPEEVVNLILFLLSDVAPMIHGETILIDGGFTKS